MLTIDLTAANLDLKIEKATRAATRAFNQALLESWHAVLDATPVHSGFLRASWYVSINGSPSSHPDKPSYTKKRRLDDLRPFRRLPMKPPRRNVYSEKFGLGAAGTGVGENSFRESASGPREVTNRDIGVRQRVEFINTAPEYIDAINDVVDLDAIATATLRRSFTSRFRRLMRAEMQRARA